MIDKNKMLRLAIKIREEKYSTLADAYTHAWRIEKEYPDEMRKAAEEYSEGEKVKNIKSGYWSLFSIQKVSETNFFDALELLYIVSRNPTEGEWIITHCAVKTGKR